MNPRFEGIPGLVGWCTFLAVLITLLFGAIQGFGSFEDVAGTFIGSFIISNCMGLLLGVVLGPIWGRSADADGEGAQGEAGRGGARAADRNRSEAVVARIAGPSAFPVQHAQLDLRTRARGSGTRRKADRRPLGLAALVARHLAPAGGSARR